MMTSIRARLLALMLPGIGAVWCVAIAWSYHQTAHEVRQWDRTRLLQTASLLMPLDTYSLARLAPGGIDVRNEYPERPDSGSPVDGDQVPRRALLEVRDRDGAIIARSPDFLRFFAYRRSSPDAHGLSGFVVDGAQWNAVSVRDAQSGRTISLIEPALTGSDLVSGVAGRIARPMLIGLPVLAVLVWVSIGRSLAPLAALSRAVRARDATRLDPIAAGPGPVEVGPLVEEINQLLARVQATFARERAFTSDAAHELKTPLAAIKVQAQLALSSRDPELTRVAMERVAQGVDRSARLAEQLLLLARLDEHERIAAADVDMVAIAQDAILARHDEMEQKDIDLSFDAANTAVVRADATLLRILIDNVLDNAIKYGAAKGKIAVTIARDHRSVVLTVADDGPGVSPAEHERITDRFFRGSNVTARGTGLGLSIVARIAQYFDATLRFAPGIAGRGLSVHLAFDAAQTR
jgi:two-component system, OmpR family, sensor histidine kinase QseC